MTTKWIPQVIICINSIIESAIQTKYGAISVKKNLIISFDGVQELESNY